MPPPLVNNLSVPPPLQLATYEKVKAKLKRRGHPGDRQIPGLDKLPRQVPESTWAGAVAGVASTLATYPFEALKDRVLIMVRSPRCWFTLADALSLTPLVSAGSSGQDQRAIGARQF
jgi:hypothetical protein